jgi:transposase
VAQELVEMSSRELDRLAVVRQVVGGRLTQAKAAELISLSERQVRRLCAAFEEHGPAGLVSGKRGKPSNRRLPDELRSKDLEIVRERYADFARWRARSSSSCTISGCPRKRCGLG